MKLFSLINLLQKLLILNFALVFCGSAVLLDVSLSTAQTLDQQNLEYTSFWTEYENIFLFKPNLVKTVFWGIVNLKGNRKNAKRIINSQVLGCQILSPISACRIDKLKIQRRKNAISRIFRIPVNFVRVELHEYKYDKSMTMLTLYWRPALFHPPVLTVNEFLFYINAARNSEYYTVKNGLEQIQLNPIFERRIKIVVNNVIARNLATLYREPPLDKRDSLAFILKSTSLTRRQAIASFDLHLTAEKVKINNQVFSTFKYNIL